MYQKEMLIFLWYLPNVCMSFTIHCKNKYHLRSYHLNNFGFIIPILIF